MATEEYTHPTEEELAKRPRTTGEKLKSRYNDTKTIYIEMDDESVIEIKIRKGLPWKRGLEVNKRSVKVDPTTGKTEFDLFNYMKDMWNDIVVSSVPKLDLAEMLTNDDELANMIALEVYEAYNEFRQDLPTLRKNLLRPSEENKDTLMSEVVNGSQLY